MMNCIECQDQLVAYAENLLNEQHRQEVDAHLARCMACRNEKEQMAQVRQWLVEDCQSIGPASLADRVMQAIARPQPVNMNRVVVRWRQIRWRAAAAAAMVLLACVLGLLLVGSGSSITLADVQAAIADKTWVHISYDGGQREVWVCLTDGRLCGRGEGSAVAYIDEAANVRRWYHPRTGVIVEDPPTVYPDGKVPAWKPLTPWEYLVQGYEAKMQNPVGGVTVEKHEDKIDGKALVRFDLYAKDATGKRIVYKRLWADPATRMPVRMTARLQPEERKSPDQEWTVAVYDFPQTGPSSIYDLGVPRDAKIVKSDVKQTKPDALRGRETTQPAGK